MSNEKEIKADGILREALKDVKQELLIIDESGTSHMAYIHGIKWSDQGLQVEFSTPDEDKDALAGLVHDAIYAQIKDSIPDTVTEEPKTSLWASFKEWLYFSKAGRFVQAITHSF